MTSIPFAKTESIGNDFVLIHADALPPGRLAAFSRRVCDRHFGIGADGLLVVRMPGSQLELRMFNPDGSEDFCGNGLRCAALYAREVGWSNGDMEIDHFGAVVETHTDDRGLVTTKMPPASFRPEDVPLAPGTEEMFLAPLAPLIQQTQLDPKLRISMLTTGTTHSVIFVNALPGDETFFHISRLLECHPIFPDRTSVMWAHEIVANQIEMRIWERGAGETKGCGTGSAAAAVVLARRDGLTGAIQMVNPGGTVDVELDRWDGPITTRGAARITFRGTVPMG